MLRWWPRVYPFEQARGLSPDRSDPSGRFTGARPVDKRMIPPGITGRTQGPRRRRCPNQNKKRLYDLIWIGLIKRFSAKTTFFFVFSGEKSFQEAPQNVEVGDTFFYNILRVIIQEKNIFHNFKLQNSCEKVLEVHNSDNRKICEPKKTTQTPKVEKKRLSSRWGFPEVYQIPPASSSTGHKADDWKHLGASLLSPMGDVTVFRMI